MQTPLANSEMIDQASNDQDRQNDKDGSLQPLLHRDPQDKATNSVDFQSVMVDTHETPTWCIMMARGRHHE